MLHPILVNSIAASNNCVQFAINFCQHAKWFIKKAKMRKYPFSDKNCVHFGITLDAEIFNLDAFQI